ncbi:MAG: hypothetical protein AB8C95_05875 [Phycisphaeraceae bacterium]
MRAIRMRVFGWLFAAIVLAGAVSPAFAQPIGLGDDPSVQQLADWIAEAGTASDIRKQCAERLIDQVVDRERGASKAVVSLLDNDRPLYVRKTMLRAIFDEPEAEKVSVLADATLKMRDALPDDLEELWVRTLGRLESEDIARELAKTASDEQAPLSQRRLATRALGEHRRLFAASPLMELTSVNRLPQVQAWAYDALANLSHQGKLGEDRAAWAQWYNDASDLNATQWQRMLHENLLLKIRNKQETESRVQDRLIQTQRALHTATPATQRPALLVELMKEPLDASRLLAMDLMRQRAEDGGEFGPVLREQLRVMLDDNLAKVREESATLLGQLLDAGGADLIATRLASGTEGDAGAERAYLVALTQMPRAQAMEPGYKMLENPLLQAQAAGMLAASHRAGQGDEEYWEEVRDRVRDLLEDVPSPRAQMVTLLGLVIEADDDTSWDRIAGWVGSQDDSVRAAAARVWAGSARPLKILAERSDDPVIRPLALRAIAERGIEVDTFNAIATRRPTEAEDIRQWERALVSMAGRVEPASVMEVYNTLASRDGQTRQVRQRMLTAAIDRSADEDPPSSTRLSMLLARARVRVLADAPALVVLDYEAALQHADELNQAQRYNARKGLAMAYFADARVDDTVTLVTELLKPDGTLVNDANKSPLLEELIEVAKAAVDQGRASDASKLLAGVRTIFGTALNAANAERFSILEAQIKDASPAPAAP